MRVKSIFTARLVLREISEADTDQIVAWRSDPEVYRFFRFPHPLTRDEHLYWYHGQYIADENQVSWVAFESGEGSPVGSFGLKRMADEVEVSYILAPEAQGMGYAYEAVTALLDWAMKEWGSTAALAEIHHDNMASIRFAERMGFGKKEEKGDFLVFRKALR